MDSLNRGINSIHQKVNLLSSYSSIIKNPTKKIEFPCNRNKLMIDSGAYDLLIRGELDDFPFTPKEYVNGIKNMEIKPDYIVSMDYICSPEDVNKNKELIKKTIKNAEVLRKEIKNSDNLCLIPVVQGYYVDDYLFCLREMIKKKIVKSGDFIGIGSLAARKKVQAPREIILSIKNELKRNKISAKIHCFGLNLNIIKDFRTFNAIDSIDSLAWTFPYRFGRVKIFTRERMIEANSRGKLHEPEFYYLSLIATLKYISFLNLKYTRYSKSIAKSIKLNNTKERRNNLVIPIKKNATILNYELNIGKVPIYTGNKFLCLEPKNTGISIFEFYYLFLSALEFGIINNKNTKFKQKNSYFKMIKLFFRDFKDSEKKLIEDLFNYDEKNELFHILFKQKDMHNMNIPYSDLINKLKEKLELRLYRIQNYSNTQNLSLTGKLINDDFYLLAGELDFLK